MLIEIVHQIGSRDYSIWQDRYASKHDGFMEYHEYLHDMPLTECRVTHVVYLLLSVYVFPGLGLGATVCGAKTVTDRMLYIAAEALAKFVPDEDVQQGKVFPPIDRIREVSHRIAVAVVEEAIADGQATKVTQKDLSDLDQFVMRKM